MASTRQIDLSASALYEREIPGRGAHDEAAEQLGAMRLPRGGRRVEIEVHRRLDIGVASER